MQNMTNEYMDRAFLRAKFDQLVDDYTRCVGTREFDICEELSSTDVDDITLDNIQNEASKYLEKFLKAGFDANMIVKMLSCEDVWTHYDILKAHGAKPVIFSTVLLD